MRREKVKLREKLELKNQQEEKDKANTEAQAIYHCS